VTETRKTFCFRQRHAAASFNKTRYHDVYELLVYKTPRAAMATVDCKADKACKVGPSTGARGY
jgi:hypothetical protein